MLKIFIMLLISLFLFAKPAAAITLAQSPAQPPTSTTDTSSNTPNPLGMGQIMNSLFGLTSQQAGGDPEEEIISRVVNVINFLFALVSALLVLAAIWTGMMYIFSMGNEEQAGKAKKNFIYILTGLVVILASFTIIAVIRNLLENSQIGL